MLYLFWELFPVTCNSQTLVFSFWTYFPFILSATNTVARSFHTIRAWPCQQWQRHSSIVVSALQVRNGGPKLHASDWLFAFFADNRPKCLLAKYLPKVTRSDVHLSHVLVACVVRLGWGTGKSLRSYLLHGMSTLSQWKERALHLNECSLSQETRVLHTTNIKLTHELHSIRAHHLHYTSLLEDYQKHVKFIHDTKNPMLDSFSHEDKKFSREILERECNNLSAEIKRLKDQLYMQERRLKNVMGLVVYPHFDDPWTCDAEVSSRCLAVLTSRTVATCATWRLLQFEIVPVCALASTLSKRSAHLVFTAVSFIELR